MHVHTHVIRVYLSRIRKNQILRSIWRLRARFYWFRRRRPERPPSRKIFRRCPPSYVRRTIHMAIWSYQSRTEIYYLIIVITYITKNTLILSRKESCAVYVYLFARLHYYTGNNFCRFVENNFWLNASHEDAPGHVGGRWSRLFRKIVKKFVLIDALAFIYLYFFELLFFKRIKTSN